MAMLYVHFSREEFAGRQSRARAAIAEAGFDGQLTHVARAAGHQQSGLMVYNGSGVTS